MSWFSKVFGRKEEKQEAAVVVPLEDLEAKIKAERETRLESVRADVAAILDQVQSTLNSVHVLATELAETEAKESMIHAPKATIQASKDTLSRRLATLTEKFEPPKIEVFDDVVEAHSKGVQVLQQIAEATAMHARIVAMQFPAFVKELKGDGKLFTASLAALKGIVDEHRPFFEDCTKLLEDCEKLRDLSDAIRGIQKQMDDQLHRTTELEQANQRLAEEAARIESTPEYSLAKRIADQIGSLEQDSHRLQKEFEQDFVYLVKPLRKFSYTVSLEKAEKEVLQNYFVDPWSSFLKDQSLVMQGLLTRLRKAMEAGTVEVKRQDKSMLKTQRLASHLEVYARRYREMDEAIRNLRSGANLFLFEQVQRLYTQRERNLEEMQGIKRRLEELRQILQADEGKRAGVVRRVEEAYFQVFSSKISVKLG